MAARGKTSTLSLIDGTASGLSIDELAFYEALSDNVSARELMADETMKQIRHREKQAIVRDIFGCGAKELRAFRIARQLGQRNLRIF